jgi:diguanylate cyclase (GGDEF)-like protein
MTSCLTTAELQKLIRPMAEQLSRTDSVLSIRKVVTEILACAQSFVPCEAGSLMMSHPEEEGALVFVASFGAGSERLPGTVLPPGTGIAGKVYLSGEPILTNKPTHENHFYEEIDRLTDHETQSLLCVPLRAFGQSVGVLSLLNRVGNGFQGPDLDLLRIFCQHLTQSIQLMMEAKRQKEETLKDHLTGLFNDRYLYGYLSEVIGEALQNGSDVGLIFLDLDHFKSVVDTHGHLVGSQALRECGHLIGRVAKGFGGVSARYGGDEYVVVVADAQQDQMEQLAEAIRATIETSTLRCEGEGDSHDLVTLDRLITASVGVVCLGQLDVEGKSVEAIRKRMIRVADMAMYQAKALGKNRVHWFSQEPMTV